MKNFITRALTGFVFVALVIGCTLYNELTFIALFALLAGMSIYEFATIVNQHGEATINRIVCVLSGIYLFIAFAYLSMFPGHNEVLIPYLFLMVYLLISELYLKRKNPVHNWAYTFMSQMYVALPFALLHVLAFHTDATQVAQSPTYNPILPLSIFIFNWANDTGAYCAGMLFGKHRLFERISPKKSWEGSIGGAVISVVAAIILAQYFTFLSLPAWIGLAITVVIFGTFGDLTESLLKRTLGIKDSGTILPGHGGMLDRFDSALMAIPATVVYLYLIQL